MVVDVKVSFPVRTEMNCRPASNQLVRVYVAQKRKIWGDNGLTPRQHRAISKILPVKTCPSYPTGPVEQS